jgi:hypothetical protein
LLRNLLNHPGPAHTRAGSGGGALFEWVG